MAISASSPSNSLQSIISSWANEFNLSSIAMHQDPMNDLATFELRRGNKVMAFSVPADLFEMDRIREGLIIVKEKIYIASKKFASSRVDLRDHAIENMNDFMTLMSREREKTPNQIDTVVLTPEQAMALSREALDIQRPDLAGQIPLTIQGYAIETRGQD